jgi:hypothetical protein
VQRVQSTDVDPCLELTILMPCLDEAETLARCIARANSFLQSSGVVGEVLVADNGSTDGSPEIAADLGARVIGVPTRGYGAALSAGIEAARGRYIIMGDADGSYDFTALQPFLDRLREGWQLVMGNRFAGGIAKGAMPPLHRYLGNPVLSGLGRALFHSPIGDFHCGLRGFSTDAVRALGLRTTGMEFASEMIVRSTLAGLRLTEVPTTLSPDGRSRAPHLRSWRDGWRHLRFLLIYSPSWMFLYPGVALAAAGLIGMTVLATGERSIGPITFGVHTLLYSALAVIVGFEAIGFARFLKYLGARSGELPRDTRFARFESVVTLERTLGVGVALVLLGIAGSAYAFVTWSQTGFGVLSPSTVMRLTIPSVTATVVGVQAAFSAFFMYALRYGPGYRD